MLSIIRIFINPLLQLLKKRYEKDDIIIVRRLPPRKVLRAHQLGLTVALVAALLTICLSYSTVFAELPWYSSPFIGLLFIMGTLFAGPFIFFVAVFLLSYLILKSDNPTEVWKALSYISQRYVYGYAFGAIFATLYNDSVLLHLLIFKKHLVKIAFAFDSNKKFNVIKSPIENEELALLSVLKPLIYYSQQILKGNDIGKNVAKIESYIRSVRQQMSATDKTKLSELLPGTADEAFEQKLAKLIAELEHQKLSTIDDFEKKIEPLLEKYLKLKNKKLYNFRLTKPPQHPYTIAFIANPKILRGKEPAFTGEADPIIDRIDWFIRSVEKALYSFETNEVLGRPEIWSNVRIIVVFDNNLATSGGTEYAFVQPLGEVVAFDDIAAENLIAPAVDMWTKYQNAVMNNYEAVSGFSKEKLGQLNHETDVIYAMTASREFTRSTAVFTDFGSSRATNQQFDYHLDPQGTKGAEIHLPTSADHNGLIKSEHELFCEIPGIVALNILRANNKSYIHEFAHAMSSAIHGRIVDEYFDIMEARDVISIPVTPSFKPFCINRIERNDPDVIPVHKVFAEYKGNTYYSDRDHPSAKEYWLGYFPDRKSPFVACTMDRFYGYYRFDELIADFMYDRLIAKINR